MKGTHGIHHHQHGSCLDRPKNGTEKEEGVAGREGPCPPCPLKKGEIHVFFCFERKEETTTKPS